MRIGRGNRSNRSNQALCHFVHHRSHMTSPWFVLGQKKERNNNEIRHNATEDYVECSSRI
jgi:hypothetical protein